MMAFYNAFRVVPPTEVAKLGDTLIRNQILASNEMRGILGFKPSDQEGADMLMNPNMPIDMQVNPSVTGEDVPVDETVENSMDQETETPEGDAVTRLQNIQSGSSAGTEGLPPDNALTRLRRFSQGEF